MALNPIAFTHRVDEEFRRYQLTAFPIADPRLAGQARTLLAGAEGRPSPLVKGPFVSLARGFRAGATLADLAGEGAIHPALATVAEHPSLFAHQEQTLRAALAHRHVLLATGTGSGKTESFLYPILDRCLRLRDAGADPGIVAVLVYPMNALAADQRDRLRSLLAGTRISYGMWIGATPERPEDADVRKLPEGAGRDELLAARRRKRTNAADPVPWEECASEQEIRERKPRILITNAKQLELLLTRPVDFELFTGAPLQFIVLDEAHTYSGVTGAEVACLVRRLRTFAGKDAREVTCIATSATIADPEHAPELAPQFLSRLCGVPEAEVELVAEQYEDLTWPGRRVVPDAPADPGATLERVLTALGAAPGDDEDEEAGVDLPGLEAAVAELCGERPVLPPGEAAEALFDFLAPIDPVRVLASALRHPQDLAWTTQRLHEELHRAGEPAAGAEAEVLTYLALGAFARRGEAPLLRPKLHVFARGLEGAVVTWDGVPAGPSLHFSAAEALERSGEHRRPTAVFPLSVCRTCGQHYAETHLEGYAVEGSTATGGEAAGDSAVWRAAPDPEAGASARVRFTDSFVSEGDPDDDDPDRAKITARLDARRVEAYLCTWCGTIHRDDPPACRDADCGQPGPLARIYLVPEDPDKGFRCAGCNEPTRAPHGRRVEPIRPLRATTVADVHILAQEMISAAGTHDERHLLVFADNRQDAAFQAGWMRDHARRYRLRYLMLEALGELEARNDGPVAIGDLHDALVKRIAPDKELARVLAPEVFDMAASEAFGRTVPERLARFLRIQILRELATAFTQRDAVERWGQLRAVYSGLDPADARVRAAAEGTELSAGELAAACAALLDVWRRGRSLHDPVEPIFGRRWFEGDPEIQRGFLPPGFVDARPTAVKLARDGTGADEGVKGLLSSRGRTQAVDFLGRCGATDPKDAVERIWELLSALGLVVPVRLLGWGDKPLRGGGGAHQVDGTRVGLVGQNERWVCSSCRRVQARDTPAGACTRIYCTGRLERSEPPAEDYNVSLLSRPFAMVTAEEHTAQVPQEERLKVEAQFKRSGGAVNTLVATPTLELGVDIGALDLVLCRNVPPTAGNYWQRVGRAGRRRRMAVIYVYCRRAVHDQYFFARPQELLGAPLRPPRFNLRNDVLVNKHVHATVLSELLRVAQDDEATRAELEEILPRYVGPWLFEGEDRRYRDVPADVRRIGALVDRHRETLLGAVERVFADWPSEAAAEVAPARLRELVLGLPGALQAVADRLHERLEWVLEHQRRLAALSVDRPLTEEEAREEQRGRDFVRAQREHSRGTYLLSVLAHEGFLPGYGMYEGGITAFPGRQGGSTSFELSRPPAVAVREFVPGNLLYANRGRYRARLYRFPLAAEAQRAEEYRLDLESLSVRRAGDPAPGYEDGIPVDLSGLPIADVDLQRLSGINDEETDRFQVPVSVLGMDLKHRRGGHEWTLGSRRALHVLGQGLRLVNVGPADRVRRGEPGYPVCQVCGATRSPYASRAELDSFAEWHRKSCGREPGWIALSADVVADALHFGGLDSQAAAANLGEALRLGAAQVLDMEPDDLQSLIVGRGSEVFDLFLYDPMPGGSGLLGQLLERWDEIAAKLKVLLAECPGACEKSCYSCLRTGRNVFFHRDLDRHLALELVESLGERPERGHELRPLVDAAFSGGGRETTNRAEDRLAELLDRTGLEGWTGQHTVALPGAPGHTIIDFAYVDERVAVYLDGLSTAAHGTLERRRMDEIIRGQLEDEDWTVVEVAASWLDDPVVLRRALRRIARGVGRGAVADRVRDSDDWFVGGAVDGNAAAPVARIPVYSIRAAAGRYLENAAAEQEGWVEADAGPDTFAVRIEGRSMEPRVPDGSVAVFRAGHGGGPLPGSRQGRIVLAQLHSASDPEGGGSYTVKRYRSEKRAGEDGGWEHARVVLESLNPAVPDIEVAADDDVTVFAELVTVLPHARVQSDE